MKTKYVLLIALLFLLALPMASAQIGTFKQNTCITLPQVANASYCNITAIYNPEGVASSIPINMTKSGTSFNATFCNTSLIGNYIVNGDCDTEVWAYDFQITPSGSGSSANYSFVIIVLSFVILLIGIFSRNIPTTILGGMAVTLVGLYSLINGIDVYRNTTTEWVSIILMSFGGFWMVKAGLEYLDIW